MSDLKTKELPSIESSHCVKHLKRHLGRIGFGGEDQRLKEVCQDQIEAYFKGQRRTFSVPLIMIGTPFQKRVWQSLLNIPYGQTATYSQLAAWMGNPRASRAVAAACKANPLPIFFPCHRVIGKQGLTGYSSGLPWKQYLLSLEGACW